MSIIEFTPRRLNDIKNHKWFGEPLDPSGKIKPIVSLPERILSKMSKLESIRRIQEDKDPTMDY